MFFSKKTQMFFCNLAVSGMFISGCGGGEGNSPSVSSVNGISVPLEPDAKQNEATLAGVDVNSNGVRDDVERKIAEYSIGQSGFENSIAVAKGYQAIISGANISVENLVDIFGDINCLAIGSPTIAEEKIRAFTVNNTERDAKFKRVIGDFSYFSDELKSCE